MGISVRTIETGEVPDMCLNPPEALLERYRDVYGGSLRQWVEEVRGRSCRCYRSHCDGIDKIGHGDSIIVVDIHFPDTFLDRIHATWQDFRGEVRNFQDVSDETASTSLYDANGNRATAFFTCDECHYQHGHHQEGDRWSFCNDISETPVYNRAVGDFPVQSQTVELSGGS